MREKGRCFSAIMVQCANSFFNEIFRKVNFPVIFFCVFYSILSLNADASIANPSSTHQEKQFFTTYMNAERPPYLGVISIEPVQGIGLESIASLKVVSIEPAETKAQVMYRRLDAFSVLSVDPVATKSHPVREHPPVSVMLPLQDPETFFHVVSILPIISIESVDVPEALDQELPEKDLEVVIIEAADREIVPLFSPEPEATPKPTPPPLPPIPSPTPETTQETTPSSTPTPTPEPTPTPTPEMEPLPDPVLLLEPEDLSEVETGEPIQLTVTLLNQPIAVSNIRYVWSFAEGTDPVNTDERTISHTFQRSGEFEITAKAFDQDTGEMIAMVRIPTQAVTPGPTLSTHRENYPNGQPRLQYTYYVRASGERIKHGTVTSWYENGLKRSEGPYQDGKRQGVWTSWYDNGSIGQSGPYLNDVRHGTWTVYYRNGRKESEGLYRNGKREGTWVKWHEDGRKHAEMDYQGDTIVAYREIR